MIVFQFNEMNKDNYLAKLCSDVMGITEDEASTEFYQMLYDAIKRKFDYHGLIISFEDNFRYCLRLNKKIIEVLYTAYQNPITFDDVIYKSLRKELGNDTPVQSNLLSEVINDNLSSDQTITESYAFGKWQTLQRLANTKVRNFFDGLLKEMEDGFTGITLEGYCYDN